MTRRAAIVPVDTRAFNWCSPDGKHKGSFRPTGRMMVVNPDHFHANGFESREPILGARLFVGFNVGNAQRWDMKDLIAIVTDVRKSQGHAPDSSFLYQKGVYTSRSGETVVEDGAQVIVLNLDETTQAKFENEMKDLGKIICEQMEQELVIVEIQRGGISIVTFGVDLIES